MLCMRDVIVQQDTKALSSMPATGTAGRAMAGTPYAVVCSRYAADTGTPRTMTGTAGLVTWTSSSGDGKPAMSCCICKRDWVQRERMRRSGGQDFFNFLPPPVPSASDFLLALSLCAVTRSREGARGHKTGSIGAGGRWRVQQSPGSLAILSLSLSELGRVWGGGITASAPLI